MRHAEIVLKSYDARCKFSKKAMYNCEVYPNDLNLTWLYSCPCGDCGEDADGSWIFFNDTDLVQRGGTDSQSKKEMVTDWLQQLGWSMVTNRENKRFICPLHQEPAMRM